MKKIIFIGGLLFGILLLTNSSLAAMPNKTNRFGYNNIPNAPIVIGEVKAINGNVLSIESKINPGIRPLNPVPASTTIYSVLTSSSTKITKDNQNASFSDIKVGDLIMVWGTKNNTEITATAIKINTHLPIQARQNIPPFQGNGQPVVGGTITAINGNQLTITNKSNVTYTVDATNAKIIKNNATSSISSLNVNDNVIIQGTVNGNSVVASSIIDRGPTPNPIQQNNSNQPINQNQGLMNRFFRGIGGFFHNLFGFF